MKIGVTLGGFCPLHQGHMDLIMRAKKENDMSIVIVCGRDNEPRGDSIHLPLIKRYRIIKNYLEDELTKVIMINDSEHGIDVVENWNIWMAEAYRQMKELIPAEEYEFTWYVGEPRYKEEILKFGDSVVLADRTVNPISGTMIRENPQKYWNKIMPPFRAYLSHNILIAGTASEGKTTLCRDIGKYFAIPYSYEKGRDMCAIKTDKEFSVKDFIYNIYEQHKYNEELICSPQNPGVFISDTDNLVTLMYAKPYAEREDFELKAEEYDFLYQMAMVYNKTTKWDKIFLIPPKEKPIVDDGERYMGDSDYKIRVEFFNHLVQLYKEFGYEYEILDGTYYENFCKVRDYINTIM